MTFDRSNVNANRNPDPDDLRRGGKRLLQLLTDMVMRDMERCEIRTRGNRSDIHLIDWGGVQTPGPDWSAVEVLGATLYLCRECLDFEGAEVGYMPTGKQVFTIDRRSGLLPLGTPALRCAYRTHPPSGLSLYLRVLTKDTASARARSEEER